MDSKQRVAKIKPAYLRITTWKDTSVWYAQHYYGKIIFGSNRWKDKTYDVRFKISQKEATKFNKEDRDLVGMGLGHKAGDMSSRFLDRDKLINRAIRLFNKNRHGCSVLFEGSASYIEPKRMLVGPRKIKPKANKLYEQWKEIIDRENDETKESREIERQWEDLTGMYLEYRRE